MTRTRWLRPLFVVLAFAALLVAAACIVYPPEYVWRVVAWRDADADDFRRFPARHLSASPLREPLPRIDRSAAVRAAWQQAGGGSDMDGELAALGTQAFLVLKRGRVVYEGYFNAGSREAWVTSFSVVKSICSALVGIAIAEGAIASIDEPITRTLPELGARDARFARITIRHLIDMASGLRYEEFPFLHGDDAKTYYFPDLRALALKGTRIDAEPGARFHYNNYNLLLLGMVLERATGMPVARYLEQKIWHPAGMVGDASWSMDSERSGFEKMESGLNARAEDFARFGLLMLQGGRMGERQVVPHGWASVSTTPPDPAQAAGHYAESFLAKRPGAWYQAFWWGQRHEGGAHDFSARGNHGQYIFVSPRDDVVIVRHGWRYGMPPGQWVERMRRMADAIGD
ncbi:serine hydrolase [Ramlibacter sp. AN1015]|uniref:serine hydrolase domain-containing protein n=1 Tax=Ramlibacter sp. AN1015 TaxID=3133428 RepID=UPI0030BA4392